MPAAPYTEDPMAGFDPSRPDVAPAAPAAEQTGYEFNPQKEITPLAERFFADVEANSNLSAEAKIRVQSGYLQGIADVREQRDKIERERLGSIMDRQRIEASNFALVEARQRQEDIARSAEKQKGVADIVKSIRDSNLPAEEKQRKFNDAKVSLAQDYATDPTVRTIFDTVESEIPKPLEPFKMSDAAKTSLIVEDGLPDWLVNSGDLELIQKAKRFSDLNKKAQSDDEKKVKEARKQRTEMTLSLAKEPPSFIAEEDLPDEVSKDDPNRLKYLTPESQQRGRDLMLMAYGPKGVVEYERLATDAERYDVIRSARDKLLLGLVEDLQKPAREAVEDNGTDTLVYGTKKKVK